MKLFRFTIIIGLAFLYTSLSAQKEQNPLIITELTTLHSAALQPLDELKERELFAQLSKYSDQIEAIDIATMHLSKDAFKRKSKLKEEDLAVISDLDAMVKGNSTSALSWNDSIEIPILFFHWESHEPISFTVKGAFTGYTADQIYISYYGTGKVKPSSLSADHANFSFVPSMLIVGPAADPIGYAQLELNLMQGSGKKTETHRVRFLVGYYPEKVGKMQMSSSSKDTTQIEVEHKKTRTFLLNAFKEDLVDKLCTPSHSGWQVKPETIELVIESSTGEKNRDWNYRKTGSGAKTCFQIEVFNNSAGPSGKLEYYLKYDIERKTTVTQALKETEPFELQWGELYHLSLSDLAKTVFFLPNGEQVDIRDIPGVKVYETPQAQITIDTQLLPRQ